MIQHIEIKNYQSIHELAVDLAPFTVMVGQSSAGKSAFTRAIKGVAYNGIKKEHITHGQQTAQVKLVTDKGSVTLTKGKPEDSYVILANDDIKNPRRYTKNGVSAPEDVSSFLGIPARDAINFAGQFDMPFLLTASGATVAATLGELTNVAAIFEASREGLRKKNSFSTLLKTRQSDLAALEPQLAEFENLDVVLEHITEAEHGLTRVEAAEARLSRINDLMGTVAVAQSRLKAAQGRTALPVPHTDELRALINRLHTITSLLGAIQKYGLIAADRRAAIELGDDVLKNTEEEYIRLLHEAGTCPTCGQNTKEIDHVHA